MAFYYVITKSYINILRGSGILSDPTAKNLEFLPPSKFSVSQIEQFIAPSVHVCNKLNISLVSAL